MTAERRLKLILTFSCYFSYFAFAFGFYSVAPTLLDIKDNVNATFQEVSYGIVVRSSTYCIGALASGVLFNIIDRRLGLISSLILMALTCITIPFVDNLVYFLLVTGVMGIASAGIEVAVNAWMLQLWQEDCNIYMQGMHFAYAVGVTIAPALASPFLSDTTEHSSENTTTTAAAAERLSSYKVASTVDDLSKGLFIPYSIASVALVLAAIVQAVFYLTLPYSDPVRRAPEQRGRDVLLTTLKDDASHCKETSLLTADGEVSFPSFEPKSFRRVMIISGCALTCFYAGLEMNSFIFLPDFAVEALHYTKSYAANVTAMMSASYAAFRFIGIFVASQVSTIRMLYIHVTLIGLSNAMIFYSTYYAPSDVLFTISVITLGAGCSCVYPAIYSYLEEKITVTNGLCGLFMFSSSIATSVNPIIEGKYLEKYPSIFVMINMTGFLYVLLILTTLEFSYRKKYCKATPAPSHLQLCISTSHVTSC